MSSRLRKVFAASVFCLMLFTTHSGQPANTKNILVLIPSQPGMPIFTLYMTGLRETLLSDPNKTVGIYIEYLNLDQFSNQEQQNKLVDWLHVKYSGVQIDAIITLLRSSYDVAV